MPPFDTLYTTFYWSAIVTTVVSCTVFELFVSFARYSDLSVENATFFYVSPAFSANAWGHPVGISPICLIRTKLEWLRYHVVKNLWQYVMPFP